MILCITYGGTWSAITVNCNNDDGFCHRTSNTVDLQNDRKSWENWWFGKPFKLRRVPCKTSMYNKQLSYIYATKIMYVRTLFWIDCIQMECALSRFELKVNQINPPLEVVWMRIGLQVDWIRLHNNFAKTISMWAHAMQSCVCKSWQRAQ